MAELPIQLERPPVLSAEELRERARAIQTTQRVVAELPIPERTLVLASLESITATRFGIAALQPLS